jgi:hypothetical protein
VEKLKLPVKVICPYDNCRELVSLEILEQHKLTCTYRPLGTCPASLAGLVCSRECPDACPIRDVFARLLKCWPETIVMNAFPHKMPMAVLPDSDWYPRAWVFHHENLSLCS